MALRQTTRFVESALRPVGPAWAVPDVCTLSRYQLALNDKSSHGTKKSKARWALNDRCMTPANSRMTMKLAPQILWLARDGMSGRDLALRLGSVRSMFHKNVTLKRTSQSRYVQIAVSLMISTCTKFCQRNANEAPFTQTEPDNWQHQCRADKPNPQRPTKLPVATQPRLS